MRMSEADSAMSYSSELPTNVYSLRSGTHRVSVSFDVSGAQAKTKEKQQHKEGGCAWWQASMIVMGEVMGKGLFFDFEPIPLRAARHSLSACDVVF